MGLLMRRFSRLSIRNQILASILGTSLIFIMILGVFSYQIAKDTIESNYREDFLYNLRVSDNIFDMQTDSIVELLRGLLIESAFMDTLAESNDGAGRYFSSYDSQIFERFAGELCLSANAVDEFLVVGLDGKLYVYSKNAGSSYSRYYREENLTEQEWISQVARANGREVFFSNNILRPEEESKDLSIAKYMINPYTSEPVGYVIVNVRKDMLREAFADKGGYETNCFLVVDRDGAYPLVYFQGNEEYREEVLKDYLSGETRQYVFSVYTNKLTDWDLVSVIARRELSHASNWIRVLILVVALSLAVCSLVVAVFVSKHIYKPLKTLEKTIDQVGEGSRHLTEQFDDSEIGMLGNKFKRMVNHNLELRERLLESKIREREAELYLLQEQINPHFLYNALDSLYCLAMIHDAEDIAEMVEALSGTFRLSLNNGSTVITVRDELKHIENYMVVQNMRFDGRFHLDIQVAEALKDIPIQKLLLEPFVENAVYHGLERRTGEGTVKIRGRLEGEDLYFLIEDNGVGVEDLSRLEQGYGITNVRERIRLYYGENYGVSFESEKGVGTKVTVHISTSKERARDEKLGDY